MNRVKLMIRSMVALLLSVICIFHILSIMTCADVCAENIRIINAELRKVSDGSAVDGLTDEAVNCNLEFFNTSKTEELYVFIGVYKEQKLYDLYAKTVCADEDKAVEITERILGYDDNYYVKCFVWHADMRPVVADTTFSILFAEENFDEFKCYFSETSDEGFSKSINNYNFTPATGCFNIELTLTQATDIKLLNSQNKVICKIASAVYSEYIKPIQDNKLSILVNTRLGGYDLYVNDILVSSTEMFIQNTDNVGIINVLDPTCVKSFHVSMSNKRLSNSVTSVADPSYFYNFSSGLPFDWEYTNDVKQTSGYMSMKKTATGAGTTLQALKRFEVAVGDNAQLNWCFRTHAVDSGTPGYYFFINTSNNRAQIWIKLIGQNLYYTDTNNKECLIASNVKHEVWHTLRVVVCVPRCEMDIYLDDKCIARNVSGRSKYFTAVDEFKVFIPDGNTGNINIDDFSLASTENVPVPKGFLPFEKAPLLKDLVIPKEPEGITYYPSSMYYEGYTLNNNEKAVGGNVLVADTCTARSRIVFTGKSGNYKVNVGYLENETATDDVFRVYHNKEELDFWYGKYDDGERHTRLVSSQRHINNGDIFYVEASVGSMVNYIEFSEVVIKENKKGVYIDDRYWRAEGQSAPSWKDNGVTTSISTYNNCKVMVAENKKTDKHASAKRKFNRISGSDITLDLIFASSISSGNCNIKLYGDSNTVADVQIGADGVHVVKKDGSKSSICGFSLWKGLRILVNTDTQKCSFVSDSKVIESVDFINAASYLDCLKLEFNMNTNGKLYIRNVRLYNGYLCNDDFRIYTNNICPYDWDSITDGGTVNVSEAGGDYTDNSRSLKLTDTSALKRVGISKNFSIVRDKLTVSFYMLGGDGLTASIGSNTKIYTNNNNIYCNSNLIWENFNRNVWYKIKAEVDYEKSIVNIYVNNILKSNVVVSDSYADKFSIYTDNALTGTYYIDDVIIENSIYSSPIEVPTPADTGNYDVAVQACDLWREGMHFGWDCIRPYDYTTPLNGYYDDGSQEQADLEIKWLAEHGISVYMPCWFRSSTNVKNPLYGEKMDAFLSSPYIDKIKFALVWENTSGINSADDFINNILPCWIERYFKNPSYYTFDNKPVIAIWSYDKLLTDLGRSVTANAELFERIEQVLINEGFSGAVFLTNTMSSKYNSKIISDCGYDYTYVYSLGNLCVEEQINNQVRQTEYGYMDAIPVISQGWGSQHWGHGIRKKNMSLADWYGALKYFKDIYMPQRDKASLASKFMMLDNWNEWGEGHVIYPSNFAGFGYLDGVYHVFSNGSMIHREYLPELDSDLYVCNN